MNVVSFGGGTNSTAMIIGMYLHKIPIDLILFADTGGEQPHTYEFIETFNGWLEKHGLPQITSSNMEPPPRAGLSRAWVETGPGRATTTSSWRTRSSKTRRSPSTNCSRTAPAAASAVLRAAATTDKEVRHDL